MKIVMQSPVPICSITVLRNHEDIDAMPSTHLQCYRAEQPWRYCCNPQCPFAVLQCWGAMKILMQSPVPIRRCYRAEQPWRYWCNLQFPFAVWQGWVAIKILMQIPVPICSVTWLNSHEDIDAIPSSHLHCYRAEQPWRYWCNPQLPFAVLQGWAAMKILMRSPVPICSVTGLSSHKDIDAIPSTLLQCDSAE